MEDQDFGEYLFLSILTILISDPSIQVGPEQWISYQAMLTTSMLEEEELNDFATFMYCRLNQPNTDYPKGLFD